MKKILPALLVLSALAVGVQNPSGPPANLSAVVEISLSAGHGSGSPVLSEPDGESFRVGILSAAHIIAIGTILPPEGWELLELEFHPTLDAVLLIFRSPEPVETFLPSWEPLRFAEEVFSSGFPLWMGKQAQRGLSDGGRHASLPVAGGMSGGPVLDLSGRLRGIVVGAPGLPSGGMLHTTSAILTLPELREWLEPLL